MTCFEFELRITEAISSDGENSSVLIWNGTVMNTAARPCGDGVSWLRLCHGRGGGFVYWSDWSLGCFWHGFGCGYLRKYGLSENRTWKIGHGLGCSFFCWELVGIGEDFLRLPLADRFDCKLR